MDILGFYIMFKASSYFSLLGVTLCCNLIKLIPLLLNFRVTCHVKLFMHVPHVHQRVMQGFVWLVPILVMKIVKYMSFIPKGKFFNSFFMLGVYLY